jgi:hypothetical protein
MPLSTSTAQLHSMTTPHYNSDGCSSLEMQPQMQKIHFNVQAWSNIAVSPAISKSVNQSFWALLACMTVYLGIRMGEIISSHNSG